MSLLSPACDVPLKTLMIATSKLETPYRWGRVAVPDGAASITSTLRVSFTNAINARLYPLQLSALPTTKLLNFCPASLSPPSCLTPPPLPPPARFPAIAPIAPVAHLSFFSDAVTDGDEPGRAMRHYLLHSETRGEVASRLWTGLIQQARLARRTGFC